METRRLTSMAVGLALVIAGAACSSARGDEPLAGEDDGSGETVTVAGCLSSAPDGRFALTAAPDAAAGAAARVTSDERTTFSYVLIGGEDLQAHAGKRVEVVGTIEGKTQEAEHEAASKTTGAPYGGGTPVVQTEEEVEMSVRQLRVQSVREVAPNCVVNPE